MTPAILQYLGLFALEFAALHVSFKWIERRWPERREVDVSALDEASRRRIAKRANRVGSITGLLAVLPIGLAWGFGFYALQLAMVPTFPGARFVRLPTPAWHAIPAIFAAIVLSGPVGMGMMILVYRRRIHEVMAIGDAHYRFDVRKFMYLTFVWIVPLCVDAESLVLGRYVVFTEDGVFSRDILGGKPAFHAYAEVVSLQAKDGVREVNNRPIPDRGFVIRFRDGRSVPSPRFAYHDARPEDFEPLKLAERKSGVPIVWVRDFD